LDKGGKEFFFRLIIFANFGGRLLNLERLYEIQNDSGDVGIGQ
jgi:hypothetical protein